jgi:cystathionine beta-lyase
MVKVTELEATYLIWIDFNSYNLETSKLKDLIENKALVWLDQGYIFGETGNGFVRINIATQRSLLKKALDHIIEVFKDL